MEGQIQTKPGASGGRQNLGFVISEGELLNKLS